MDQFSSSLQANIQVVSQQVQHEYKTTNLSQVRRHLLDKKNK
jgi:hypothetical protein